MIMVGSMLWTPPPGGDAAAYAKSGKSIESETSEEVRRLKHPRMILHTLDRRQKSHAIAHFRHASEFPAPLRDAHDVVRRGRFGLHERHGAPRILGRDDVIAIEDLTRQVAGPLHDHFLGDAGVDEVADARPTEVMRDPADLACGRAGLPPGIQDVPNRLAPAVEDPGHEEGSDRTSLPPALDQLQSSTFAYSRFGRTTSPCPTTRSRLPFARAGSPSRARSSGRTRRLPPRELCAIPRRGEGGQQPDACCSSRWNRSA